METPEVKACGLWIRRRRPRHEFLLMRHADRWDLPKGHLDPGETEMECALRETREETGLAAEMLSVDEAFRFELRYPVRSRDTPSRMAEKTLVIFHAVLLGEFCDAPIQLTEHIGFEWFGWRPPHSIQPQTIDALLRYAEPFVERDLKRNDG